MKVTRAFQSFAGSVVVCLVCITVIAMLSHKDAAAQTIEMSIGHTGFNPGTSLPFIAQKENLFVKNGLKVKIIETTTPSAVQAMLGGSMQAVMSTGGAAFPTATLEGASPFVLVSSWLNVLPYMVFAAKDISRAEDLKNKFGQVGASFGSVPDIAVRLGLTRLGLDPEKDVKLVQMARPDWLNVLAQLERGNVQFALFPVPYDRVAERRGFQRLFSLPDMNISWQNNGEWVLKSYLSNNREAVRRLLLVVSDAISVYVGDKKKTLTYLSDFLRTNPEDTEYAYGAYLKWIDRIPRPKIESLETILQFIKKTTPKAASANPASFVDTSVMDQLIKEGYFK